MEVESEKYCRVTNPECSDRVYMTPRLGLVVSGYRVGAYKCVLVSALPGSGLQISSTYTEER